MITENHREWEDQEGNNSSKITADFVCVIYVNYTYHDQEGKSSTVALNSLPETMRAPPSRSGKSPGKVSLASFPLQLIPGDMSPGIGIPSDKMPGKAWNCRWR
ncbi:hypothetical protein Tco_1559499 [Tanacetum coccineum]